MNSLYSAQHVINIIVKQSKEKINNNKLVKSMLVPYSNTLAQTNRNDAILHAGTHFDQSTNNFFKKQIDSQQKPKNNIKDTYSFFSLKKTKIDKKQNLQLSIPKQSSPKKALKNFFKTTSFKSNTTQKQKKNNNNVQTPAKSTLQVQSLKDTFFVRIQDQKQVVPKFMQKEQRRITYLRDIKNREFQEKQTERKRDQQSSEVNTARQKKLSAQLQSHLSKPDNHYTFDVDGALLLCSSQNNKKAIAKVYPPGIRYDVQNEQDYSEFSERRKNSNRNRNRAYSNLEFKRKEKLNPNFLGAKGQIFKSSVLKTINLSRISMGNQHLDEAQFMKRNDLFNNNHSRQTTNIPYLKMEGGTSFKQTATNQYISNKDVTTQAKSSNRKQTLNSMSESRARSYDFRAKKQFKKYSLRRDSFDHINIKLELQSSKKDFSNIGRTFQINKPTADTRHSSFYIQRPHTTQVGRIKRQNQTLYDSMLQRN